MIVIRVALSEVSELFDQVIEVLKWAGINGRQIKYQSDKFEYAGLEVYSMPVCLYKI